MLVTKVSLKTGLTHLMVTDADLKRIIEENGAPPLWSRQPGFATLVHIILEQQVSLASARAAFEKLTLLSPQLSPGAFLSLRDDELKGVGFSRQKTKYVRNLSEALSIGTLCLERLERLTDQDVMNELMQIKGIGKWTAKIYLLMALRRQDVWPVGDLALIKSVMHVKGMASQPTTDEMESVAESWRPWRSVAARVLWNNYLIRLKTRSVTS